jgi:hypothetical protein
MILKLMDTADLIMTKELQGADEKELKGANQMRRCLQRFVPEWKVLQTLWAKKAWQSTIRHQILQGRATRAFSFNGKNEGVGSASTSHKSSRKKFSTSAQRKLHEDAMQAVGLGSHVFAQKRKLKNQKKHGHKKGSKQKKVKIQAVVHRAPSPTGNGSAEKKSTANPALDKLVDKSLNGHKFLSKLQSRIKENERRKSKEAKSRGAEGTGSAGKLKRRQSRRVTRKKSQHTVL